MDGPSTQRYLPGVNLPGDLQISTEALPECLAALHKQDLVIVASPMAALRGLLVQLRDCPAAVAWLCKGFEAGIGTAPGLMGHEIQAQVAPGLRAGVLSGPSFAQEVALGQPTALVAASVHADVREALVVAFHSPTLRVYANQTCGRLGSGWLSFSATGNSRGRSEEGRIMLRRRSRG